MEEVEKLITRFVPNRQTGQVDMCVISEHSSFLVIPRLRLMMVVLLLCGLAWYSRENKLVGVALAAILSFLLWRKFIRPLSFWKNMGVPQSKPWIFFGDTWRTLFRTMNVTEYHSYIYNLHPHSRYCGFYQFNTPRIMLRDPELIKKVTIKDFDHFTDHRSRFDPKGDPIWSRNLFGLKGQKWREMRITLSGSFTSSKMKHLFDIINKTVEQSVQYCIDKQQNVIKLEMKDFYSRITNDIIATTAFGIQVNSLTDPKNDFYELASNLLSFKDLRSTLVAVGYQVIPGILGFFKVPLLKRHLVAFFSKIIQDNIKTRQEQGIVRPDMINLLLEARKGIEHDEQNAIETGYATVEESTALGKSKQLKNLTDEDIISQAFIFFIAGYETVSRGLCFGSYELALNKDIQDKLREEIRETHRNTGGILTYDSLLKMKYLDMVVSEMLRKWPPAGSMDRECTKAYTIEPITPDEKPVHLKPGIQVWYSIYALHRDPNYYPDPEKFDPERFSDENKKNIVPYTYLPFGSGPRNCIGSRFALLELKAILFHLLLNFEIVTTEKTIIPLKFDKGSLGQGFEGGMNLGFKRIKDY